MRPPTARSYSFITSTTVTPSETISSGAQSRRMPFIVRTVKNESGRSRLKTAKVATIAASTP